MSLLRLAKNAGGIAHVQTKPDSNSPSTINTKQPPSFNCILINVNQSRWLISFSYKTIYSGPFADFLTSTTHLPTKKISWSTASIWQSVSSICRNMPTISWTTRPWKRYIYLQCWRYEIISNMSPFSFFRLSNLSLRRHLSNYSRHRNMKLKSRSKRTKLHSSFASNES